ncbi:prolyl 4-hydroxylase subunit alpha-1 [Eurytemora carolleeae]|uniref:prolyl 4-hydroxylase subunit alpha-1 n=1 Tax=Eurytemora carolleeae TaxID=1294199 RepID=UPI000C7902E6|nr:prolyl 4-hydroxylase subunit alpha-1 [Eurytemora carolleeae]|eukprot:XP_023349037.1 prolyl 4-hydroxylase subunit alpha-1-like [Eurytemora affinis]
MTLNYLVQNNRYFILHPVAVEEAYPEPHRILIFHNVLTLAETDLLAQVAKPLMAVSQIGASKEISENRISRTAFIPDNQYEIVDRINRRINLLTGLSGSVVLDPEGKKEEFEYLQIASYGTGGHFYLHHDPMFVYKDSNFVSKSVERVTKPYNTGDRMTTLMFYLTEVKQGGYTAFPRLGVSVRYVVFSQAQFGCCCVMQDYFIAGFV